MILCILYFKLFKKNPDFIDICPGWIILRRKLINGGDGIKMSSVDFFRNKKISGGDAYSGLESTYTSNLDSTLPSVPVGARADLIRTGPARFSPRNRKKESGN